MQCETAFNRKAIHFNPEFVESPEWHTDLIKQAKQKARYQTIIVRSTAILPSLLSRFNPKPCANSISKFPLNHYPHKIHSLKPKELIK